MSFLLRCPNCGERSVYEFRFGGEKKPRPALDAKDADWTDYRFYRTNLPREQAEWWFHRSGCREWFQTVRNIGTNEQKP